jgi:hypothetical protein
VQGCKLLKNVLLLITLTFIIIAQTAPPPLPTNA